MEYVAFAFAIFGFMAYLELSSLKGRVKALEEQLAHIGGTAQYEDRAGLRKAAGAYLGKAVKIELKEGQEDVDILMYGNSRHGSNILLDLDGDWLLVHVSTPKGEKDKLIRLGSVQRISLAEQEEGKQEKAAGAD